MKKKIILAATAIGLGFSINASAGLSYECRIAPGKAEYYCNYLIDNAQCSYWINVVRSCGLPVQV